MLNMEYEYKGIRAYKINQIYLTAYVVPIVEDR